MRKLNGWLLLVWFLFLVWAHVHKYESKLKQRIEHGQEVYDIGCMSRGPTLAGHKKTLEAEWWDEYHERHAHNLIPPGEFSFQSTDPIILGKEKSPDEILENVAFILHNSTMSWEAGRFSGEADHVLLNITPRRYRLLEEMLR